MPRWIWLLAVVLGGCLNLPSGTTVSDPTQDASAWSWNLPIYVPAPRVPADNPPNRAKFALGRYLFYDARLSGNGTQRCASCHIQSLAFTNGHATATGSTGDVTPRSVPTLGNAAWNSTYTWANPALGSLEAHHSVPLFSDNPVELGITDANAATVLARLNADPLYPALFAAAFPGQTDPIVFGNIIKAIATFVRGILAVDSRYDRYLQGRTSLTPSELRGLNLFMSERADCFHCHGSFNFNEQVTHIGSMPGEVPQFHNTGLYNIDGQGGFPVPNRGLFESTGKPTDMGLFRAPSLRNVAVTAPYMHDGSIATLSEVIDFYIAGGRVIPPGQPNAGDGRLNPYKDSLASGLALTLQDKLDLIAFLGTLTDETMLTDPRLSDPFLADATTGASPLPAPRNGTPGP